MKIYLVIDDNPDCIGFDEMIYAAFLTKRNANKYVKELKEQDSYLYQYTRVTHIKVTI